MKMKRGWRFLGPASLALGLATVTGCQTWVAGMTLPSGHYLEHPPQYFPPSPAFPLTRELATQEGIQAAPGAVGAVGTNAPGFPGPAPEPGFPPGVQ